MSRAVGDTEPDTPLELDEKLGERTPRTPEEAVLPPSAAQSKAVAIVDATILLGDGNTLRKGTVVFEGGRITAVGPSKEVPLPSGAEVIQGRDKYVTPGLIDTHSHMGVYAAPHVWATADGNEMTDPTAPYVFSEHAFWPQDPALQRAVAGGVTTIQVLPGSGNVIGGRAVTLKLKPRIETRAMRFPEAPFGLKMACGENPKRYYGKVKGRQPMSRMGNIAVLRKAFIKARAYRHKMLAAARARAKWEKKYEAAQKDEEGAKDPGKEPFAPDRDIGMETLADVLDGKIKVHIHCYRADEMLQMIALSKELGFKISSFHHAVEAYKIADVLAREGIGASMWADWWGFKLEAYDGIEANIAMLAAKGGLAIVHSDSNIFIQRQNQEMAKALYSGRRAGLDLDEGEAIKWITQNPARVLGIYEQTGSLQKGKMADVVLWDKSPFSVYAKAERVFVDGVSVFDRARPGETWSDFEVGGPLQGDWR